MSLSQAILKKALVDSHFFDERSFDVLFAEAEKKLVPFERYLYDSGAMTEEHLGQLLAGLYHVRLVNIGEQEISKELLELLPESFAREQLILPIQKTDEAIVVATDEPDDIKLRSLLGKYLRTNVEFVYATPISLQEGMSLYQKDPAHLILDILEKHKTHGGHDTTVVEIVNTIFDTAYILGTSDIHLEPEESHAAIRYRFDGILHHIADLPLDIYEFVVTRLKVMSSLPTDEHRSALDGKIRYKGAWSEELEVRISIVPTVHAEKVVMRLLSEKSRGLGLADLGMSGRDLQKYTDAIHRPWGMVLITGPTGSGKTTSLYAALRQLNTQETNITSIEDPVEYEVSGINQIQVNEKTNLTFAQGLRSIVRQDPDIIMVGEIRDSETANIAVNAAMTGHILLSTLHTNDAATAFPRLIDMGVESFLVASTVHLVVAQRLVRKICRHCVQSHLSTPEEQVVIEKIHHAKEWLKEITGKEDLSKLRTFKGAGCTVCHQTGYAGRIGIFEAMSIEEGGRVRTAIMDKKNAEEIRAIAMEEGMTTMFYDGLNKVVNGVTTLEEVLRVAKE